MAKIYNLFTKEPVVQEPDEWVRIGVHLEVRIVSGMTPEEAADSLECDGVFLYIFLSHREAYLLISDREELRYVLVLKEGGTIVSDDKDRAYCANTTGKVIRQGCGGDSGTFQKFGRLKYFQEGERVKSTVCVPLMLKRLIIIGTRGGVGGTPLAPLYIEVVSGL